VCVLPLLLVGVKDVLSPMWQTDQAQAQQLEPTIESSCTAISQKCTVFYSHTGQSVAGYCYCYRAEAQIDILFSFSPCAISLRVVGAAVGAWAAGGGA
jgi:hypothetical protein